MENKILEKKILKSLSNSVVMVLKKLNKNGYKAYIVGGAIRNIILNQKVKDFDVCTDATPEEITKVFGEKNIFQMPSHGGKVLGTVGVKYKKPPIEITTFRSEGDYSDNRRPDTIEFVKDLQTDLSRRDFTMNAIAYGLEEGVVDLFGGQEDIKNKIIRCVNNADDRFNEDHLRMVRAIRFANQLKFSLDDEIIASIDRNCLKIKSVAAERIRSEFFKILSSKNRLFYFDYLKKIQPDVILNFEDIDKIDLSLGESIKYSLLILYRMVDVKILDKFKFSNEAKSNVISTIMFSYSIFKIYNNMSKYTDDELRFVLKAKVLSQFSSKQIKNSLPHIKELLKANKSIQRINNKKIKSIEDTINDIFRKNEPIHIKQLAIKGYDLFEFGIQGKEFRELFFDAQMFVWKYPNKNNKKEILSYLRNIYKFSEK